MNFTQGGFGTVFLDCDKHENCVCKRFREPEDYLIEIFFLGWLKGVTHGVISAESDSLSIHMEKFDGDLYRTMNKMTQKQRLETIETIERQIQEMHKLGVAWGDLRPENVLVCFEPFEVRIADFSLSVLYPYTMRENSASSPYNGGSQYVSVAGDRYAFEVLKSELERGVFLDRKTVYSAVSLVTEDIEPQIPKSLKMPKSSYTPSQKWIDDICRQIDVSYAKLVPLMARQLSELNESNWQELSLAGILLLNLVSTNSLSLRDMESYLPMTTLRDLCSRLAEALLW